MLGIDQIQTERYAVIEVVYDNAHSERIIVEYTTHDTLCELIAGSRIVASGLYSRLEASDLAKAYELRKTAERSAGPRRGYANAGSLASMVQAILRRLAPSLLARTLSRFPLAMDTR